MKGPFCPKVIGNFMDYSTDVHVREEVCATA